MVDRQKIIKLRNKFRRIKFYEYGIDKLLSDYFMMEYFSVVLNDKALILGPLLISAVLIKCTYELERKLNELTYNLYNKEAQSDEEYLNLKRKYDTYVEKISEYIKSSNLTDPIEIGMIFTILMDNGLMSITDKFQYKKVFSDQDQKYPGTLGARIASGYGVCRNTASLLTDVYRTLGYNANFITVTNNNNNNINRDYHAVSLVTTKDGNIIIDPTWKAVATVDDDYRKTKEIIYFDGKNCQKTDFFIQYYDSDYYAYNIDDEFFIDKRKNRQITKEEIKQRLYYVYIEIISRNIPNKEGNLKSFKDNNKDLIEEISTLEQDMMVLKKKKNK